MSPIDYHSDCAVERPPRERKAKLVHESFGGALGFYCERKAYRAGLLAMLGLFFGLRLVADLVLSLMPHNAAVISLTSALTLIFTTGASFALAAAVDCWLLIHEERWHWNNGICRATGKAWQQSFVGTWLYRRVCYRSEQQELWLTFIEPED